MDTNIDTAVAETGDERTGTRSLSAVRKRTPILPRAKLSRTKSRDEAAEALSEMLADAELEADQKGRNWR